MTTLETAMLTHGFNKRGDRQKDDFYATPPEATQKLLDVEKFDGKIYEPCCGQGHISKVLNDNGYDVEDPKNKKLDCLIKKFNNNILNLSFFN